MAAQICGILLGESRKRLVGKRGQERERGAEVKGGEERELTQPSLSDCPELFLFRCAVKHFRTISPNLPTSCPKARYAG